MWEVTSSPAAMALKLAEHPCIPGIGNVVAYLAYSLGQAPTHLNLNESREKKVFGLSC